MAFVTGRSSNVIPVKLDDAYKVVPPVYSDILQGYSFK